MHAGQKDAVRIKYRANAEDLSKYFLSEWWISKGLAGGLVGLVSSNCAEIGNAHTPPITKIKQPPLKCC